MNHSEYCSRKNIEGTFEDIISNANFNNIFISYNDEGLIDKETLLNIIKEYYYESGIEGMDYKRFKADSRNYKKDSVRELIFWGKDKK
jgi:adenine-specific DNA-methyltransferase